MVRAPSEVRLRIEQIVRVLSIEFLFLADLMKEQVDVKRGVVGGEGDQKGGKSETFGELHISLLVIN